jgi:hypothetical protein
MAEEKKEQNKSQNEEYKLSGSDLVKKVKEVIEKGNARRIIIKNEDGVSILEIPVTLGVVGMLLAPYLAAVGAVAAVVTSCSLEVVKIDDQK